MGPPPSAKLLLEAVAQPTHSHCEAKATGCSHAGSHPAWYQQQRPVAHVPHGSDAYRHHRGIPTETRTGESRRPLAQVCSQAANRLVRTRMLGGVGGVRSNAAPIPIVEGAAN